LKTLALNQIRYDLAQCDIVEESFSKFAARYDEVRNIYIEQLAFVWMEDPTMEVIRASVDKKIDRFIEGELGHATEMLSALWDIANTEGEVEGPSNTESTPTSAQTPTLLASVKTALIESIRRGVFFDRKYWARHSKAGKVLKPVYFSSTIMKDKSLQLNKLVTYLKGQSSLASGPGGEDNIESDCDGDSSGVNCESQTTEEKETRAVLTIGSFSAWKSLFFYRCTERILFAPLKSQGVELRLNFLHEKTIAAAPPPCSPKSIYVLAKLLKQSSN